MSRAWLGRPWVWVCAGVVVLAVLFAALRYAPMFSVETIKVSGNEQVSSADVVAAAAVPNGTHVLNAPLDQIAGRIEALDAVADATVTRDWPNGLTVVVRERRPVGYVTMTEGVGLVGSDGSVYRIDESAPHDLPQLPDVAVGAVGDPYRDRLAPGDVDAFETAVALPPRMQRSVSTIATSVDGQVVLTDDEGVTITWGTSEASETKARVVELLMRRPGWGSAVTSVDVTAPQAPALD